MVLHLHKLVQQIFSPLAVVKKDINKRTGHSVGLKNVLLLECGSGDEVATVSSIAAPSKDLSG